MIADPVHTIQVSTYGRANWRGVGLKQRLFKYAVVLGSMALSLVIAELFLRVVDYHYSPIPIITSRHDDRNFLAFGQRRDAAYDFGRDYIYDPYLLWRPIENRGRINQQGYVGDLLPTEKPAGSYRIFTLGDSNTIGQSRPTFANWPQYLQELARSDYPAVTVTNAGVDGYTAFQGLRRLQSSLIYRPDLVLVCFGSNDAKRVYRSDTVYAHSSFRRFEGACKLIMPLKLGQLMLWLMDTSEAIEVVLSAAGDVRECRVDIEEYKALLEQMVEICRSNGSEIVLMTRPFIGTSSDRGNWKFYAPLYVDATRQVAARKHVLCVDLFERFHNHEGCFMPQYTRHHGWIRDESHFSPKGHRAAARFIYDAIQSLVLRKSLR